MDQHAQTVCRIVATELEIAFEDVGLDAELEADLGVDSLAAVQIGYEIEVALDVEMMPEELIDVRTVADLVAFVAQKLAQKQKMGR